MNNHVTVLEIDVNALEHNLHYFKKKLHEKTKQFKLVFLGLLPSFWDWWFCWGINYIVCIIVNKISI